MDRQIYKTVKKYCDDHYLIKKGDGVVLGVSGGADSVFLFKVLTELQKEYDIRICVVHINHGIRGEEADRDEKYVKELAEVYRESDVLYRVFHADIPAMAKETGMTEEEMGRIYRYECFEKVRKELGFQKIAVAHHADDQAETVIFQLMRGSSLRGLGGMRPCNDVIIRPLLSIRRKEIEKALEQENIEYCTDSTNEDDEYSRNQIRHHVIPYLEGNIQKEAVAHITKTASHIRDITDYIDMQVNEVMERIAEKGEKKCVLHVDLYEKEHIVIKREVALRVMEWVSGRRKDITSRHIDSFVALCGGETGKRLHLPYQMYAGKDYNKVWVELMAEEAKNSQAVFISDETECAINQNITLEYTDGKKHMIIIEKKKRSIMPENIVKNDCTKWFDYAKIKSMPKFRRPVEGDFLWLRPDGAKKKLNRIFIDSKIPSEARKSLWVLAEGSHVLWIPELGRTSAYYYVGDATTDVLCIEVKDILSL